MAESKVDFGTISQALQANNVQMESGNIVKEIKFTLFKLATSLLIRMKLRI